MGFICFFAHVLEGVGGEEIADSSIYSIGI
jgi:hypothetical protein